MEVTFSVLEKIMREAFDPMIFLFITAAQCSAFFMILSAIFNLRKFAINGDQGEGGIGQTMVIIMLATFLWNVELFVGMLQDTAGLSSQWPLGSSNPLGYSDSSSSNSIFQQALDRFNSAKRACILFIQLMGFFSIIRGLHVWHSTTLGYKNSSFWKGFFHVVGGAVAINFNLIGDGVFSWISDLNPNKR